jgi:hypothetical protein
MDDHRRPVRSGLHPVCLVYPPMGDVTAVRVDDFEGRRETRDQIGACSASRVGALAPHASITPHRKASSVSSAWLPAPSFCLML